MGGDTVAGGVEDVLVLRERETLPKRPRSRQAARASRSSSLKASLKVSLFALRGSGGGIRRRLAAPLVSEELRRGRSKLGEDVCACVVLFDGPAGAVFGAKNLDRVCCFVLFDGAGVRV